MTSTTESYLKQVESIRVQDCLKITIDTQFLTANFELIKQCLSRVNDLQNQLNESKETNKQIYERLNYIQKEAAEQKTQVQQHTQQIKDLKNSLGEDFMRKFDELQAKAKSHQNVDDLVQKIQALNKFVGVSDFRDYKDRTQDEIKGIGKVKDQLSKYVDQYSFKQFKQTTSTEFEASRSEMGDIRHAQQGLNTKIGEVDKKASQACNEVKQNSDLMKEINFLEMQEKMRRHKQESDSKLAQFATKLKKKVGTHELNELEKGLIEKLDKFFGGFTNDNASKNETKDALLFLEKRINQICEFLTPKEEDEQDSLFAAKKWNCASCAKDLGKYQGKLGQFRPWAVFPCREMNPEQSGGLGYLNYIEKISYKRGNSVDDGGLDRLSKTFYESSRGGEHSPPKKSSTKATNFMSAYGSSTERPSTSLKEEYFRVDKERGLSSKMFRVKRDKLKEQASMLEVGDKERVKDMI